MRRIGAILLIAVFTIVSSVIFAGETKNKENCGFSVSTPNHEQSLGGKSGARSQKGLSRAEGRSESIKSNSDGSDLDEGSDDISGGTTSK